jgi:hypothetical protein
MGASSCWDQADGDHDDPAGPGRPEEGEGNVVAEHPVDDHWLEDGLERRRARRRRPDVTEDEV